MGRPLTVNKLFRRDCKVLVDKVRMRILSWKHKCLSYAGRLQLIGSVLSALHVYWASVFKLPVATISEIEKICRGYLWSGGDLVKGKAKVKWKMVCSPKENGGLGLKDLRRWNDVLLSKHVWNIVNNKKSLWVKWVYKFYLKERNFWDIQVKKNFCWTWKRILIARNIVRPHIVSCIGSGENTSLWHDWWHPIGILSMLISRSEWIRAGFNDMSKVKDIFVNGQLCWPTDWLENYPGLMDWPLFVNNEGTEDKIIWRDNNGKCKRFSCKQVWSDVNFFGPKVP